jgi:hypothetical protein
MKNEEIDDWKCENCGATLCYYENCHECGPTCHECAEALKNLKKEIGDDNATSNR